MSRAIVHHWNDLPTDSPMQLARRQRVIGENAMVSRIVLEKGFHLPVHQHDNEQITCVLSGLVRFFFVDGSTAELGPGAVLELPGNVPHGADALEDSVLLDIFSPVSLRTGIDQVQATSVQA
jgi:quercetin dioxygenase-like cupin family protein